MIRGIYTAASGMLVNQKRLDVIANNLANASTTGFKRDTALSQFFQQMYLTRLNDKDPNGLQTAMPVGPLGLGTFVTMTATRLTSGPLQMTGNPLDVAISGDGFFAVETPQGVRYTRQGNFMQDANGTLVTQEGYPVLVDGSAVNSVSGPLSINEQGQVSSNGVVLGSLTVVTSRDLGAMRKEGNGFWVQAGAGEIATLVHPAESTGEYRLHVGALEGSNVESVLEMVEMMTTMRTYEMGQKAVQAQDETLGKAVSEVGRVG